MLPAGSRVSLATGGWATVGPVIGTGAEGVVYEARGMDGRAFALKWYFHRTEDKYALIDYLVTVSPPGRQFLWPLTLAFTREHPAFGYLMPLCPPGCEKVSRYINGKCDPAAWAIIRSCHLLARAFQRLHARGLCYRDISFGNVLLNPDTGDIYICDNDNIGIDDGTTSRVLGTPRFMAPEILRGTAVPSARTDLHSLAVALFWMLTRDHPLEGTKTVGGLRGGDLTFEREHYGRDPVFVFDPDDTRNRPTADSLVEEGWRDFPAKLRTLFTEAFSVGLTKPEARVSEWAWTRAMRSLRDSQLNCPGCRYARFVDPQDPNAACPRCGAVLPTVRWLATRAGRIVVGAQTRLWSDHFGAEPDEADVLGMFVQHPEDRSRWALRNLTNSAWTATLPGLGDHPVDPGRAVECRLGTAVRFGRGEGTVVE